MTESGDPSRESGERFFKELADFAPVMIWRSRTDGLCDWFNKPWLDFVGRPMEQEVGNGWTDNVHPDDFGRCLQIYLSSFNSRQPFTMSYRLKRHDGVYREILDNGAAFYRDGEFAGYFGSCIDISDRMAMEAQLRQAQKDERFRLAVEGAPNGMVLADGDGRIVLVNTQTEKLFCYSRDELIGKELEVLLPERFRSRHPGLRSIYTSRPAPRAMGAGRDLFARRKDGAEVPVEIGLNPIMTDEGMLVLAAIVDITERKKAEERQSRLASIVDASRDAILSKSLDGIVTSWNPGAEALFGYSAPEMIGQPIQRIIPIERVAEENDVLDRLKAGQSVEHFETERITKQGEPIPVSITISPIKDTAGRITGASSVLRDITERAYRRKRETPQR